QRLLPAHAAPDRVDALAVDAKPREGPSHDLGHPGEIVDLALPSPRVQGQAPSLPLRVDDGERAECGKPAPEAQVHPRRDASAVRRDHEGDRRMPARVVPTRQNEVSDAARPGVGYVTDPDNADEFLVVFEEVAVAHSERDKRPQRSRQMRRRLTRIRRDSRTQPRAKERSRDDNRHSYGEHERGSTDCSEKSQPDDLVFLSADYTSSTATLESKISTDTLRCCTLFDERRLSRSFRFPRQRRRDDRGADHRARGGGSTWLAIFALWCGCRRCGAGSGCRCAWP